MDPILVTKGNIGWSIAKWTFSRTNATAYLSVIIHANDMFSKNNLEKDVNDLACKLWQEWRSQISKDTNLDLLLLPKQASYLKGHRWRYAKVSKIPDKWHMRTNTKHNIALAGDWLAGPRIECAWISGRNAANSLLARP